MNPSPELFARLLPDVVVFRKRNSKRIKAGLRWHLIELELSAADYAKFSRILGEIATTSRTSAPWQQRLTALAQVKGVL